MKVLLFCDDFWHPAQVAIEGTKPLTEQGLYFDTISDANDFSPSVLWQYSAVLLVKSDEISQSNKQPWRTKEVQQAFSDYVKEGGGLVAVHSAIVASKNKAALDDLLGCSFIGHPNACPVTVAPVKEHPVTEGVGLFCETDEHYRINEIAKDADILLASYSPPQGEQSKYKEDPYHNTQAGIYAAGFVRKLGKGRVCVLTPGHLLPVWLNPQFQKLLGNSINWVSEK